MRYPRNQAYQTVSFFFLTKFSSIIYFNQIKSFFYFSAIQTILYMGNKEFTKEIAPDGNDRLRIKIAIEKGKITDILVQYETKIIHKWHPVVRYDCSHGFFHRDILNLKGETTKQAIPIHNLKDALTFAEQDIKDRWQWYKDRFKKKAKK